MLLWYMDGSFQNSLLIWKPGRESKGGGGAAVPGTDQISAKTEVKYVQILKKLLTRGKPRGMFFEKRDYFKGKPVERQGRKARRD